MRDVIHRTELLHRLWFAFSAISLGDGVVQNIVIVSINVDLNLIIIFINWRNFVLVNR